MRQTRERARQANTRTSQGFSPRREGSESLRCEGAAGGEPGRRWKALQGLAGPACELLLVRSIEYPQCDCERIHRLRPG